MEEKSNLYKNNEPKKKRYTSKNVPSIDQKSKNENNESNSINPKCDSSTINQKLTKKAISVRNQNKNQNKLFYSMNNFGSKIKEMDNEFYENPVDEIKNMDDKKKKELEASLGWIFYTDNIKKNIRENIQKQMKFNDKLTIILAFIGIIFNIIASTFYITFEKTWNENHSRISIVVIPNSSNIVFILRSFTSITTLLLYYYLYKHYKIRIKYETFKQKYENGSTLYSTGLLWILIFEYLVCSIHSPPFMNNVKVNILTVSGEPNYVDVDIFLSSLIPIRVYLLFRYYSFYSSWADDRAEKICHECNTYGGISFAIKAELKERPYTVVGVLMILSILIFGYALRNIELSFMQNKDPNKFQDWTYVYNGFWCIMITILTVGYGDFYPQTSVGRIIAVIACLWGTFLISLMVVSLTISVEFTPQEQKAYDELKKGEVYNNLKKTALNLIRFSIKLKNFPVKREQIKEPDMRLRYISVYDKFKHSLNEFSLSRKFVLSREHETGAENILFKLNENVGYEMENIINISNKEVTTLLDYLKLSQSIQEDVDNCIEKLDKMTEGFTKCLEDNTDERDSSDEYNNIEVAKMHAELIKLKRKENKIDEQISNSGLLNDEEIKNIEEKEENDQYVDQQYTQKYEIEEEKKVDEITNMILSKSINSRRNSYKSNNSNDDSILSKKQSSNYSSSKHKNSDSNSSYESKEDFGD